MLEEISKLDHEWRKIAVKICGNKSLADDIVNDMYLKMHKLQPKTFNRHYISYAMYHIFVNIMKTSRRENLLYIEEINPIELDDDNLTTRDRLRVNDILENELGLLDCEMLLHTHEKSLRKTGDVLLMSYGKVQYQKKNALDKLLQTNGIKNWSNER